MLQVARPSSALVVVDVQNDFISGSLAIINCPAGQNGEDVSSVDSRYLVHIYEDVRRYLIQGVQLGQFSVNPPGLLLEVWGTST